MLNELISRLASNFTKKPTTKYYNTWQSAENQCDGYATTAILESVVKASRSVAKGEALYERDGVTYRHFAENAHLVSALRHIAKTEGQFQVLDFGGALGSIYRQHRWFLNDFTDFVWCVVEQKTFVETGKEMFENNKLKFESSISEAYSHYKPNIALMSNALQRVENPFDVLDEVAKFNIPYLFIDRTPVIESAENRITRSIFPAKSCHATYPSWLFSEADFKKKLQKHYRIIDEFDVNEASENVHLSGSRQLGFFCEKI